MSNEADNYSPDKSYEGVVNYSFKVQLTFPESQVERDYECKEEDRSPTHETILETEAEIKAHLEVYGHSIESVDVCIECDDLLGYGAIGDDKTDYYTYYVLVLLEVNTVFDGSVIEVEQKRKKSYLCVEEEELERLAAVVEEDLFQNYSIEPLEVTDVIGLSETHL